MHFWTYAYINKTLLKFLLTAPITFLFHSTFCDCSVTMPDRLRQIQLEYYDKLKELVDSRRYDTRTDFTVVLQPHMRDQYPLVDVSILTLSYVI